MIFTAFVLFVVVVFLLVFIVKLSILHVILLSVSIFVWLTSGIQFCGFLLRLLSACTGILFISRRFSALLEFLIELFDRIFFDHRHMVIDFDIHIFQCRDNILT